MEFRNSYKEYLISEVTWIIFSILYSYCSHSVTPKNCANTKWTASTIINYMLSFTIEHVQVQILFVFKNDNLI